MIPDTITAAFKYSCALESHEADVKAVHAPRDDLLITGSRDSSVCTWGRDGPKEREFHMTGVGLGHGSYVNSVTYIHPTRAHPHGLVASGSLSSLILIHEGPSSGAWASAIDGEEGRTPGSEESRPSETPIHTLVGHSHNVCSLSVSASPYIWTSIPVPSAPASSTTSTPSSPAPKSKKLPRSRPNSSSSSISSFGAGGSGTTSTHFSSVGAASSASTPASLPSGLSTTAAPKRPPIRSATPVWVGAENGEPLDQLMISTSWDCTARVWSCSTWEEKLVLRGHKEAVWAGVVVEGKDCGRKDGDRTFLTGSADKLIIHWDADGKPIRNFKGSTSCVRGIVVLPNEQFASCSNDGNIHIWSFEGETLAILTGHTSFIYSICLLPDGDIASSGEDHSVRIWRNGKQIQTILHPAISVWSVAALPNGDILTGASDNQARIFTRNKARQADPDLCRAYEEAVTDAVKTPATEDEAALSSASAFRLSVDVADDEPPLQLDFNINDEPRQAASDFVASHKLPPMYVDQIEGFLKNQITLASSPAPVLAYEESGLPGIHSLDTSGSPAPDLARRASMETGSSASKEVARAEEEEEGKDEDDESEDEDPSSPFRLSEDDRTLAGLAQLLKKNKFKNICVLAGAGISTSAGIPDFRSPETGLYANLEKYQLPFPEAIFELEFFKNKPEPFFELAKELYPGKYLPTPTHYFFRLLHKHGILRRVFTQNIDTLERIAGLPPSVIVEAHGSFANARCISCRHVADQDWVKAQILEGATPRCQQPCCKNASRAFVKPDIVFFGESLPKRFFELMSDLSDCDLLIVLGTSLKVHPFASLIDRVPSWVPRLLINAELVGEAEYSGSLEGFEFDRHAGKGGRDVVALGRIDDRIRELAKAVGWEDELDELVKEHQAHLLTLWSEDNGDVRRKLAEEERELAEKLEAVLLEN